jgi:hypothetical protein
MSQSSESSESKARREFEAHLRAASEEVDAWPAWKQRVFGFDSSTGSDKRNASSSGDQGSDSIRS